MEGYDLWREITHMTELMERAIRELKERGKKYAQSEHDYRIKLSARLIELRASGNPVTHLADIARGEPEIARLKMERDIAESLYESNKEAIQVYKIKVRVLEGQLQREWGGKGG